jgi:hypothetical protein
MHTHTTTETFQSVTFYVTSRPPRKMHTLVQMISQRVKEETIIITYLYSHHKQTRIYTQTIKLSLYQILHNMVHPNIHPLKG